MLCSVGLSTYIISDLNGEKIVVTFSTKELQKTNQKQFMYMLKGKATIILLTVGLIKKTK